MKRRVKQTNSHREPVKRFHCSLHVFLDIREELFKGCFTFVKVFRHNHLTKKEQSLFRAFAVEHVLCAEKTDSLCSELNGLLCVGRCVCVGANLKNTSLVNEFHEGCEIFVLRDICGNKRHLSGVDKTFSSVKSNIVAFLERFA